MRQPVRPLRMEPPPNLGVDSEPQRMATAHKRPLIILGKCPPVAFTPLAVSMSQHRGFNVDFAMLFPESLHKVKHDHASGVGYIRVGVVGSLAALSA